VNGEHAQFDVLGQTKSRIIAEKPHDSHHNKTEIHLAIPLLIEASFGVSAVPAELGSKSWHSPPDPCIRVNKSVSICCTSRKEQQEPLALVIYTAAQATDSEPLADTTVGPS